jgi:hypothetical protein
MELHDVFEQYLQPTDVNLQQTNFRHRTPKQLGLHCHLQPKGPTWDPLQMVCQLPRNCNYHKSPPHQWANAHARCQSSHAFRTLHTRHGQLGPEIRRWQTSSSTLSSKMHTNILLHLVSWPPARGATRHSTGLPASWLMTTYPMMEPPLQSLGLSEFKPWSWLSSLIDWIVSFYQY